MMQQNHPQWCLGRCEAQQRLDRGKPKFIINQCKTSALANKLVNSDDLCICLEEKIQKQFKFQNSKVTLMEQTKAYKDYGNSCINDTGVAKGFMMICVLQEVLLKGPIWRCNHAV
jgi:hypothetical protein